MCLYLREQFMTFSYLTIDINNDQGSLLRFQVGEMRGRRSFDDTQIARLQAEGNHTAE